MRDDAFMMQAVQLTDWQRPAVVRQVPRPRPGPGQVLLEVRAAGLCHSDLHLMHWPAGAVPYELPFTLGHEVAGTVAGLGPGAEGVEVGDSVIVYGPWGCGRCAPCSRRRGAPVRGARAGRARVGPGPRRRPGRVHDRAVAAADASHWATSTPSRRRRSPTRRSPPTTRSAARCRACARGPSAVVIGVGGLGHVAVQILRALTSCRIVAVDRREQALELAARGRSATRRSRPTA